MTAAKVFLAFPHYGQVEVGSLQACYQASREAEVTLYISQDSRLPYNFNKLWCEALNTRASHGWTHFAMLHSDIVPEAMWLDILLSEQRRTEAQVLAAVVPIKDERGLTSTGVYRADGLVTRLTMTDVQALPLTFRLHDIDPVTPDQALVVNTGCWVCDFTQPWVEQVAFKFHDGIVLNDETSQFSARTLSEDWDFSLQCLYLGVSVAATRAVSLKHVGSHDYGNTQAWGTQTKDEGGR